MSTDMSQAGPAGSGAGAVPPAAGDKVITDAARAYVAVLWALDRARTDATIRGGNIAKEYQALYDAERALLAAVDANPEATT